MKLTITIEVKEEKEDVKQKPDCCESCGKSTKLLYIEFENWVCDECFLF